jgi:hypothetical protein
MKWRKRERKRQRHRDDAIDVTRDELRIRNLFDDPEIQRLLQSSSARSASTAPPLPVRVAPSGATLGDVRVDNHPVVVTAFSRLALGGGAIEAVRRCRVVQRNDVLGDVA